MAITVIDGYDEFDTAGLSAHGYTLGEFAAGQVTIASGGRNSTNGMRLAGGLFNTDIYKTVGFTSNVLTMRFAFYIDAQASNITFSIRTGSTVHLALQISNSDKKIRVYLGGVTLLYTLAPTLALDTWYFIEVSATIHDTTGTLAIYLNGTPELTVTGIDTLWTGSGPVTNIGWQADAGATVLIVDDLSVEPALVVRGDTRVITRFPTSDGQAGWTPSSGGTHYTLVDEPAVNPADYVVGTAAGVVDTYGIAALGVSATVIGLAACYSGHADAAGVRGVSPVVRIGSTNYTQAQTLLGVSETWQEAILQTSPATSVAFTVAEVNAAQYGVALTA